MMTRGAMGGGAAAWAAFALAAAAALPSDTWPPCSADTLQQPCRLKGACARTAAARMECWANVVARAKVEDAFALNYISPPMDMHVSVAEATEGEKTHFLEAVIHMDAPLSIEPAYARIRTSLPTSVDVVDLLSELRHFKMAISSFVDIAGVTSVPDSNDLLLHPRILRSANWRITLFEAECDDPNILNYKWHFLEKTFNLTHLVLQGCHLNFHLEKQPYLQNLEITSCNLQDIPIDFFEKMPNILSLSLSSNNLSSLPHGISHLKNLQHLELLGNNLISTQSFYSILSSLRNLQRLHLSKTFIKSILILHPLLNTSSLQLTSLRLPECQLPSLQEEDIKLLSKQTKLETIDLSNNKIDSIPINWINLPASVKILNLSSNFLTSVQFVFSSDIKLKVIDISNNKLTVIDDLLLSGSTDCFNVSFNNVFEIHGLNYGRNINNLNLSYNMIQTLSEVSVSSLSNLQSLDLGSNFFDCQGCNVTILQKWINGQHNVKIMALNGTGDLFCFPRHRNLRITEVNQEECEEDLDSRNPEWARIFQISLVLSLIFLMVVLLRGYKFETCYLMRLWQNRSNKTRSISQIYQYDVFVCYSNADREWVIHELMATLEEDPHYYRICDHERDFTLGSLISQNVLQSMHLSRHILFVLSESFFNSQWCLWELEMARHREFEGGGSSPILLQLTPIDQLNLSDGIKILLDSCRALHKPNESLYWKKLINMLGPSLAKSSEKY